MVSLIFLFILVILFNQKIRCNEIKYNYTASRDDVLIVTPSSFKTICNRINIYKSYQKCLCDQYCLKKNNCCPNNQYCMERQYRDDELTCGSTLYGDVRMVNTCLPNFEHLDAEYVRKCQTTDTEELMNDFLLSVPVTTVQNITYRNLFCAVCNNVPEYLIWNVVVDCESDVKNPENFMSRSIHSSISPELILSHLVVDSDQRKLISNISGSLFKCFTQSYLPYDWPESLQFCDSSKKALNCPLCEQTKSYEKCMNADLPNGVMFSLPLRNPYLPKNSSEELYEFIYENRDAISEARMRQPDVHKCFSTNEDNSPECPSLNEEYGDFRFINTEIIFVQECNASFDLTHWNRTLIENVVRFCPNDPSSLTEKDLLQIMRKWIGGFFDLLSLIFLIIFVIINFSNKNTKLSNLPRKIIFSFSITLLPLYALDRTPFWDIPCTTVTSVVGHYLYLSFHVWLVIAAYEFWRFICYFSEQCQRVTNESHLKRYSVYCLIGWMSPLSVIGVGLYFDIAPISVIPCEIKPGYGRTGSCFLEGKVLLYFYSYPSTALFSIVIFFFTYTFCYIYSRGLMENSSCMQNNYKLLVKLALGMGLPWTIDLVWMYTEIPALFALSYVLTAPLGVFIFFAYSFERSMVRCQCACNREFGEMISSAARSVTSKA